MKVVIEDIIKPCLQYYRDDQPIYYMQGNEIIILTPKENGASKFGAFYVKHPEYFEGDLQWQSIVEYLKYESH